MGFEVADSNNEWHNILQTCRNSSMEVDITRVYICSNVSAIWVERNTRIFQKKHRPPQLVMVRILEDMKLYIQRVVKDIPDSTSVRVLLQNLGIDAYYHAKEPIYYQWRKPDPDYVKLNTDGSLTPSDQGFGGIARKEDGTVHFAYMGSNSKRSILQQELLMRG
ncbi:hypothetical protein IFM89_022572 [Coptis chinensis]|uniref:RNase H type-1 domain-containing protein n=1 Tax=Coptis chinensis TaxID=261450 RepID=A0A835LFA6_9MAGN|nr:hypothetical protein IFM89_022572 [Coptis chinensis]